MDRGRHALPGVYILRLLLHLRKLLTDKMATWEALFETVFILFWWWQFLVFRKDLTLQPKIHYISQAGRGLGNPPISVHKYCYLFMISFCLVFPLLGLFRQLPHFPILLGVYSHNLLKQGFSLCDPDWLAFWTPPISAYQVVGFGLWKTFWYEK